MEAVRDWEISVVSAVGIDRESEIDRLGLVDLFGQPLSLEFRGAVGIDLESGTVQQLCL